MFIACIFTFDSLKKSFYLQMYIQTYSVYSNIQFLNQIMLDFGYSFDTVGSQWWLEYNIHGCTEPNLRYF